MQSVTLKLTVEELRLLATLASDQLFRREFIDPRMPGFKPNPAEVSIGKELVVRCRLMIDQASRDTISALTAVPGHALGSPSKLQNRIPDAL
jgi:hypothetical protein